MVLSIPRPPSAENKELPGRTNYLLSLLSESDFNNLIANANRIFLPSQAVLYKPQELIQKVYFPLRGIISLVNTSQEGLIAEVVTVSNEGMVGIAAFLGGYSFSSFAVIQTDCVAISLDAEILQKEFNRGGELQTILLSYTQFLLSQIAQNVFCSCHHTIEQRLARYLISFSDRLNSPKLLLTQEILADLLGVRRSSLSVVAKEFRQRNLIDYSRGRIIIQNPVALRKIACQCDRLLSYVGNTTD